jgi:hypothetical protein
MRRAAETAEIIARGFPDIPLYRSRRLSECVPCIPWDFAEFFADIPAEKIAQYGGQAERAFDRYFKRATAEIDRWFWFPFGKDSIRLPNPADVEAYRRFGSDDFRFTIKVLNSITLTHFYKKAKADPLVVNPYFLSPLCFRHSSRCLIRLRMCWDCSRFSLSI